jgi:putative component of membrane protein insertase Oxa1/YidC/SpoIIIJ protein YidD
MGVLRVFRCSSLFSGGYDPVPDTFSVRALFGKYSEFWHRNEEEGHDDDQG